MRKFLAPALISLTLVMQTGCASTAVGKSGGGYASYPEAKNLIDDLVGEGMDRDYLTQLLDSARRQDSILKVMSRPAEKRLTWGEYRNIFIKPKRIDQGVEFWRQHADTLARAEQVYGVPPEIVVAIIGVETRYGRITGNYRVLDALSTLGFDYPKRGEFFRKQLKEYVHLVQEEHVDPLSLKGSYAGAMGYGQFMPSSYRAYAVDFDGDHKRDIWDNPDDAIGSVANYFARHGWTAGAPIVSNVVINRAAQPDWFNAGLEPKVTLAQWADRGINTRRDLDPAQPATLMKLDTADGEQYRFGLHNFYVITRYNHSQLYGMAVYELSQAIREAYQRSRNG